MKLDNQLSRLLDALGPSTQRYQQPQQQQIRESADEINAETVGAVRLAADFGVGATERAQNSDESRSEKVARLRAAVQAEGYSPDAIKVAESVARDLL